MSNLATIKSDTTALTSAVANPEIMEKILASGDLAALTPQQRVEYYAATCQSLNLNPLTRPFEYIELDGKLKLYTRKDATDQLRKANQVTIDKVETEKNDGLIVVTIYGHDKSGRYDVEVAAVSTEKENGEWKTSQGGKRFFAKNGTFSQMRGTDLANAHMKAVTKAKRRLTLSLAGLGWTDESEIETIPNAQPVEVAVTGEIISNEGPDLTPIHETQAQNIIELCGHLAALKQKTNTQIIEGMIGWYEQKTSLKLDDIYSLPDEDNDAFVNAVKTQIKKSVPEDWISYLTDSSDTTQPKIQENEKELFDTALHVFDKIDF